MLRVTYVHHAPYNLLSIPAPLLACLPFRTRVSPHLALTPLESKVQSHRNKQRSAKDTGPPFVKVLGCSPLADSATAVKVDDDRVDQAKDGQESEDAGHQERRLGGVIAKVEECDGDSADVNGEFELHRVSNASR